MQGKAVSTFGDTTLVHRISGLAVDMSGAVPALTVTFDARVDDGPVSWQGQMSLAGDEFVNVFGQPSPNPSNSRVEDIVFALFEYAISSGFIVGGVFDPE